jgi:hypothetical protein
MWFVIGYGLRLPTGFDLNLQYAQNSMYLFGIKIEKG